MVDEDSADVWARPEQFRLDASVGVPPDAFSGTGQDWGMPVYRWDAVASDGFRWLRMRARRSADLFDGYRVDHVVGFYRTYARPRAGGEPFFTPADEVEQTALGERVLEIFRAPGADIVAEDLGTVPDFVRASLARLGVPGFRVFRWERFWHVDGQPFRDPSEYPADSVAATGTHDTEPLATWWRHLSEEERAAIGELPTIRAVAGSSVARSPYNPGVRDALVEALYAAPSKLVIVPLPDVFGWEDRINEPATVSASNWTFRLPWPSDRLADIGEARAVQARLRDWARKHGRA
jgi:4-alpha-glucanotransferase